jgi:hypothetical protein
MEPAWEIAGILTHSHERKIENAVKMFGCNGWHKEVITHEVDRKVEFGFALPGSHLMGMGDL